MASNKLRLGIVQLAVTKNKLDNLNKAGKLIKQVVQDGAKIVTLPECFNSPYGTQFFPEYAETIPGETTDYLSKLAKENKVYIIGGSIPEVDKGKYYNTCPIFDPTGRLVAKHRKVHLFDIDIPGKITFKESEVLTPGDAFTVVETDGCKVGVGICFDIRFPEMAQLYAKEGCKVIIYPGAFNMTTGPAHWTLLQRSRAVDNQVFVATVSPARNTNASYVAWGHSMVVNPWGNILVELNHEEGVACADIDLDYVEEIRGQIPVSIGRRDDLYDTVKLNS